MADNVAITAGSGTTIAADDVGGVMYQRVKIATGADGSATDVSATAPIPVAGQYFDVTVAPTVTAGAYSAGDIMGALLTFSNVARAADEEIVITGVQVACKAAVAPALTLVLFNADPSSTTKTDNAAYSLNAADVFKVIAAIPLAPYIYDHGTPNTWNVDGLGIVASPVSAGRDIYGLLIDATGVTLTSTSDIQVRVRGVSG